MTKEERDKILAFRFSNEEVGKHIEEINTPSNELAAVLKDMSILLDKDSVREAKIKILLDALNQIKNDCSSPHIVDFVNIALAKYYL